MRDDITILSSGRLYGLPDATAKIDYEDITQVRNSLYLKNSQSKQIIFLNLKGFERFLNAKNGIQNINLNLIDNTARTL